MNMLTHLNELLHSNGGSMAELNSYTLAQSAVGPPWQGGIEDSLLLIAAVAGIIVLLGTAAYWASRYKKCPSNKILVIYGKVSGGKSAKTLHGGGAFIWPIIQSYQFMSLEPMWLKVDLNGALAANNIRVNVPSTFTVALDTDPAMMNTAAVRLLGITQADLEELASEIILGSLRQVVAQMDIEEINKADETFERNIRELVGKELGTVGLHLITWR